MECGYLSHQRAGNDRALIFRMHKVWTSNNMKVKRKRLVLMDALECVFIICRRVWKCKRHIIKSLVVYIFTGNVMTTITALRT